MSDGKIDVKITLFAVLLVLACLWLCYFSGWGRWYFPLPYHALQAEALLHGRLALSYDIRAMDYDLAWYNGGVQQLWGLGVPIWRLPFDVVCQIAGMHQCPDVVPLFAAVALWACYTTRTALTIRKFSRSLTAGMLVAQLFLFSPVFWNWAIGYHLVYEETCFYATLLSTSLLTGVIRFVLLNRTSDFYLVCSLSALSGLVRPTHALYGLIALVICGLHESVASAKWCNEVSKVSAGGVRNKHRLRLRVGMIVGISGFMFLAFTNYERFGSPFEFGHRLSVSSGNIVYATRFGNPMSDVSAASAGIELSSWLFLSPLHNRNWGAEGRDSIPFQAPAIRWRNSYMSTYDPSWLIWFLLSGIATGSFLIRRILRRRRSVRCGGLSGRISCVLIALWVWFAVASVGLGLFYLRFPTLSSRYILDFGPAFLAPLIALILLESRRWPKSAGVVGVGWITAQVGMLLLLPNVGPNSQQKLKTAGESTPLHIGSGALIDSFHGQYSIEHHPSATGISMNGNGWRADGASQGIVQIMVDQPQYVEITVEDPPSVSLNKTKDKTLRAKIGNTDLMVASTVRAQQDGHAAVRVRFSIPKEILRQHCDQIVTFCFARSMAPSDLFGERRLYNVRWHDADMAN